MLKNRKLDNFRFHGLMVAKSLGDPTFEGGKYVFILLVSLTQQSAELAAPGWKA